MRLRTDGLTQREIDGETVMLDLVTSTYLTTNPAGTLLLNRLIEDRTREELSDALMSDYDIDRAQADADTDAFLTMLADKGLLLA